MLNRNKIIAAFVLIGAIVGAYFVGKWNADRSDNEIVLEERVRQAEYNDSIKTVVYTKLADSLTTENKSLQKQSDIIKAIKQLIWNDIKNTAKKIDALPDSAVQHYVDSIRAENGFN